MTPRRQQISALAHCAHTLSRLSVSKHQWSREAELAGKHELADKWRKEAARLRLDAGLHLAKAQSMADAAHYFE